MMARLAKLHQYRVVSYLRDLGMNSGKCAEFKTKDFVYGPGNYRNKIYFGETAIFRQCEDHQIQDNFNYAKTVVFDKCNKEFMSKNYNQAIFPNIENIILANHLNKSSDIYNFSDVNIFIELPIFFHIRPHALYSFRGATRLYSRQGCGRPGYFDFFQPG